MRLFCAFCLLLLTILTGLPPTYAMAGDRFTHPSIAKDAARYEKYVRETWKGDGKTAPGEVRKAALKQLASDPRAASRTFAAAVAADPKNSENWLGLAEALLAIKPDENQSSERYDLPVNASGAAYRAYELAGSPALQAKALAVLGTALEQRSYWRPAIDALRISLELAENPVVRATYDRLQAEHGFRMTDYRAEAEAASPRICAIFSENLSRTEVDFARFVSVDGKDPQNVSAEGSQLCVEGLTHGARYQIQIRAGLPSDVGEAIAKPINLVVYVPDRKPTVRFTGRNYVLPSRGQQGIPVVSVNTQRVDLEIYRIGDRSLASAIGNGDIDRQLYAYDLDTLRSRTGEKVYEGSMDVAVRLNEEVTTAVPLNETVGALKPGAYVMIGRPGDSAEGESWSALASQWFIVSDLGLTAFSGDEGVDAFVRSLAEAAPLKGIAVKLVARNNEILGTAQSDAAGHVRFDAGLTRGEGGLQPALLVAESSTGEYAFLDLTTSAFDLSDRGVKGREAPGPVDAFLYTERGVYRPGEEVNITALVRDAAGVAVSLPVTLILSRPDGVEHARFALSDEGLGGRTRRVTLSGSAMTGTWRAKLHTDPQADAIAQVSFLVEDYVPERLDMTLAARDGVLMPDKEATIDVSGRYLYGPPAAGLALEGDIVVRPAVSGLANLPGFRFGLARERMSPARQTLDRLPATNADGTATIKVSLPAIEPTAQPLEAQVMVRLKEVSGRFIERAITIPVDLAQPRIGVKPLFGDNGPGEGAQATFEVVALDASGRQIATNGLVWELQRLETTWQWYSRDGSWTFEPQTLRRKVASGTLDTLADNVVQIAAQVDYGRFELVVRDPRPAGPETSVEFNAGWVATADNAESPEILDVALDKASYKAGETARLRIATRHGGKALITVLGQNLKSTREVEIPKGGGEVEIPVGSDWGPGAYATALLYRPMDETAKRMPSRSIGVAWISIDQAPRTLAVKLDTSEKIASGATLKVPVKISGLASGEEARVTIAAVDVGILNLTRYQTPQPERHFYAQRKLAMDIRDFYGRLIDGMRAERGRMRSGGDGMEDEGLRGSPPVEETVAHFSGILKVNADGTAEVEFAMPNFNGTVRVMAVAWTRDKVGHASTDVIVRDAVALTVSAPRFLTLGDEAQIDLSVHNVEGADGNYTVAVSRLPQDASTGSPEQLLSRPLALKTSERKSERLGLKPSAVGQHVYDVTVTGPGEISVARRLTLDVKPPAGDIRRTTISLLKPNGGKITLGSDLLAGLIANRTRVNISVGTTARLDVPGLLTALDRYPYGCAEQTVSRALPLVYANAVAASIGLAEDKAIKDRVQGAIERVFEMQDGSGAFGVWGPSQADMWLTAYVTDFLTRAKEAGFTVRERPFAQALDRLQNFISYADDNPQSAPQRAYALYVLARNGRAPMGELRYLADEKLDQLATPLARAQLGAALSMVGDKERAQRVFNAALGMIDDKSATLASARDDYGSPLRDGAALVTLAVETGLSRTEAPRLVDVLVRAFEARTYTSTQEQAWMLLAAHALADSAGATRITIDGTEVQGNVVRSLTPEQLKSGVVITNDGETPVDAVISVMGAAMTPEPAISKGFTITRSYYTLDGQPVALDSATGGTAALKQNDRLVAVIKVESDEGQGQVLVVDRVPAGLEIDNPRLIESGAIAGLEWLKASLVPRHSEFRDDRFVAAFDFSGRASSALAASAGDEEGAAEETEGPVAANPSGKPMAAVAYVVRAVTAGDFVHPAATVEDMYRPERYARSASGRLTIAPR